jgi:hypothetical protein
MHGRNNDGDASGFEAAMRGGSIIITSQGGVGVERRNLSASRDWAERSARLIAFEPSHDGMRQLCKGQETGPSVRWLDPATE